MGFFDKLRGHDDSPEQPFTSQPLTSAPGVQQAPEAALETAEVTSQPSNETSPSSAPAPTVLVIGDIFSDAFIKLNENYARIDTDPDGSKRLSLPFGSKPPYDEVEVVSAVGPGPNAAVAMQKLGLAASIMAFQGDDEVGKNSINYLHSIGVSTDTLSVQPGMKSNYYYVLRYGADRTILVKNEAYDYKWTSPAQVPGWIYLALISKDSWQLHEDLLAYLEANPTVKFAFQPGTFHFEWGPDKLAGLYRKSEIIVVNREEAAQITGQPPESIHVLASTMHALGPKIVVITDGPKGSYASYDGRVVTIPNYPDPAPPLDRTGAGDAFASTIVSALAQGETMETALTWAPINSMNVVQKLGAQAGLVDRASIESSIAQAPADYKVTELAAEA